MTQHENNTEMTMTATMTLNGIEVPLTATFDMLAFRKADAEAIHQMVMDDGPPSVRDLRRTEHLGTDEVVHRHKYWRGSLGAVVHATAFSTVQGEAGPWTSQGDFTRYSKGGNQHELPEVKHLDVPGEEGVDYSTGVALATFNGIPVEISMWVDQDGDANIRLYAGEAHKKDLKAMLSQLETASYEFLRGKILDGQFNILEREALSSHDVLLDEEVMRTVQRHVVEYRRMMPAIQAAGEQPSRGLLLAGPPGCGKTSLTRHIIASMPETTFVLVTGTTIQRDGFRSIWELVRRTDAMLVLEDIDACGAISRDITDHPLLSQLLELLDGVEGSGCVQVLATTNHVERLDTALTARPGRFDRIIRVEPPNAEVRRELLRRCLHRYSPESNLNLDKAVSKTDGFTGAFVSELAKSAWLEAMYDGEAVIRTQHLNAALGEVSEQFSRALAGHRSEPKPVTASSIGGWE